MGSSLVGRSNVSEMALIQKFKESRIPAIRKMEHAKIVEPAIDVIELVFNAALANLPKNDIDHG
jgi:hypothetical protein